MISSDLLFQKIAVFGNQLLFFDVFFWTDKMKMPFLIFWLLSASIYFAIITKFVNIRKLPNAILMFIKGKKTINKTDKTVSSKSIVLSAIAGASDIGSIAGLASVIAIYGAGVIFWLIVAGFLSASIRYAEVLCGHKFRKKKFSNGKPDGYNGGPQVYIPRIFSIYGCKTIGRVVVKVYATMLCLSTFASLQVNQSVQILTHTIPVLQQYNIIIALIVATIIIFVAIKGITGVAKFNQNIVPLMITIYIISTIIILIYHHDNFIPSIKMIFEDAFTFNSINGSIIGALIIGTQRAFFCNESGMGSGAIIHSNSSNKDSKKEAIISMITPIVSVIIICFCSGMIVLVSKSYMMSLSGTDNIIQAFSSVHPLMKYITLIIVPMFGITTAVSWAYYGSKQFSSLFGKKRVLIYYVFLFISYFMCGIVDNFNIILDVADFLNLSITIPNIIALIMMSKIIIRETNKKIN